MCFVFQAVRREDGVLQAPSTLDMWEKSVKDKIYQYNMTMPGVSSLSVAFKRSRPHSSSSRSNIKIYEVEFINTLAGGASECAECVLGGSKDGCDTVLSLCCRTGCGC